MLTIWKFTIRVVEVQEINMPRNAQILCAKTQGNHVCLWAKLDDREKELVPRRIAVRGTGKDLGFQEKIYIDTVELNEEMWHVFEIATEHTPETRFKG